MKQSRHVYGRHIRDTEAERAWSVATCHDEGTAALIAALLNAHAEDNKSMVVRYGTTSLKLAPFKYDGGAF